MKEMKAKNTRFMELLRAVPEDVKTPITDGPLAGKGFTSVNPSWRIQRLTEVFGPVGFGWWYEITDKRLEGDMNARCMRAFVDINLYIVDPETGETSHAIPGTGGSDFVYQEYSGSEARMNSDCFKAALTDAISVAAKALGLALDVYMDKDSTKYDTEGPGYVFQETAVPASFEKQADPQPMDVFAPAEPAPQPEETKPEVKKTKRSSSKQQIAEETAATTEQQSMLETAATEPKQEAQPDPEPEPAPEPEPEAAKPSIDPEELEAAYNMLVPVGKSKGKTLKEAIEEAGYLNYFANSFQPGENKVRQEFKKACQLVLAAQQVA